MEYLFEEKFSESDFLLDKENEILTCKYSAKEIINAKQDDLPTILCSLGAFFMRGGDLLKVLQKEMKNTKNATSRDIKESEVIKALITYIDTLRGNLLLGKYFYEEKHNKPDMGKLVDLLENELLLRYQETPSDQGTFQVSLINIEFSPSEATCSQGNTSTDEDYLLSFKGSIKNYPLKEEEILRTNKWASLAEKYTGNNLYFNEELICPGDEEAIKIYNNKANADNQFNLHVPPEPWTPNLLKAPLILLSLNPGYVEYLNKDLANMFREDIAEQVMEDKKHILRLNSDQIDNCQATRILAERYWRKILTKFAREVYPVTQEKDPDKNQDMGKYKNKNQEEQPNDALTQEQEQIFKQVAICQYVGYTSSHFAGCNYFFPSQKFTKMLLLRLAVIKKGEVKFLIMRGKDKWKALLGEGLYNFLTTEQKWDGMNESALLYVSQYYRSQYLTENNIGETQYDAITHHLNPSLPRKKQKLE